MIRELSDLPSDPDRLKAKLFELASAAEEAAAQRDAALLENEKLLFILAEFKRALFGRRSEKLDPDQLQLIFDIAEAAAATTGEAGSAQDERAAAAASKKPRKPATRNRGMLPQHLPRIEIRIDVEDKTCPCGGERHLIGETVTEMLDVVPAQFFVGRDQTSIAANTGSNGLFACATAAGFARKGWFRRQRRRGPWMVASPPKRCLRPSLSQNSLGICR